ncbi:unnamed protein product [Phaeothamnion confervicola]
MLGHLLGTLIAFGHTEENGKATADQADAAEVEIKAALVLALVCFAFDFAGQLLGLSVFMPTVNAIQTAVHGVGCILMALFIRDAWDYRTIWYVVGFLNIPTALMEAAIAVATWPLKIYVY